MSRRSFLARGIALAATPYLLGSLTAAPSKAVAADSAAAAREGYFAYCDRLMRYVDPTWSPAKGYYGGGDAGETMSNANLLLVHATLARFSHRGAARQDERARSIAARLCTSPPWHEPRSKGGGDQAHDLGWQSTFEGAGFQHVVVDTAIVRGLAAAYVARNELRLPDATVLAIRDRIRRCAYGTFYEFPQQRLNQINWPVEIYAHAANVLGESHLLQHDARLQLGRFADHITTTAPGDKVPYTGPGYHFHYLPQNHATSPANVDNAEYANLVCGVIAYYEQARRAGMTELTSSELQKMRAWIERVLEWYADRVERAGGLSEQVFFGVASQQANGDARLAATRMMGNACRAVIFGLDSMAGAEPPPLYAYDPDSGRLAITTPAYNTAIVAVNQHAFQGAARHRETPRGLSEARLCRPVRGDRGPRDDEGPYGVDRLPRSLPCRAHRVHVERAPEVRSPRRAHDPRAVPELGASATVTAVLHDGSRHLLGTKPIALRRIAWFHLAGEDGGYVVVIRSKHAPGRARLLHPKAQSSAPRPGPTLALELLTRGRLRPRTLTVRYAPALDAQAASILAKRLGGATDA